MKKRSLFKNSIFATLFILLTVYGLSKIGENINSDILNPISHALGDFRLTDIVFSHLRERPGEDTNIVLVNIGGTFRDRSDLARMVNIINHYEPKVIGIDAFFRKSKTEGVDRPLEEAFSKVKNLVLVSETHENPESDVCDSMSTSHPRFMKYAQCGFADMITKGKEHFKTSRECTPKERVKRYFHWKDTTVEVVTRKILRTSVIRKDTVIEKDVFEFGEKVKVKKDTTLEIAVTEYGEPVRVTKDTSIWKAVEKDTVFYSFPVKLASIFAPEKAGKFLDRNKDYEIINFQGNIDSRSEGVAENARNNFTVLDWTQVEDTLFTPETIKGKIVMIGYLGDELTDNSWEDKFFTPLNVNYIGKANPDMYGVEVHANIVSMILRGDFINEMPDWLELVLGIIVTFLNAWLFSYLFFRTEEWFDGLTNMLTLLQIVILIGIVIFVFDQYNYIVDVTLPSVALFLTGNLIEIYWNILKPLLLKFRRKVPYMKNI